MKIIERKLTIGFAAMVLLLLIVTAGSVWEAVRFRHVYSSMREAYSVFVRLDQALTGMLTMEASVRGFVLSGQEGTLRPYESSAAVLDDILADLRRLAANDPALQARVAELEPVAAHARQTMAQRIAERRAHGFDSAAQTVATAEAQRAVIDFGRIVRGMAEDRRRSITERLSHAANSGLLTSAGAITASLLAIISVVVAGRRVRRDLRARRDAEAALRESFNRIEDLYNNAPCGYHSIDERGIVIAMNDTALRWLGYTREEVVTRMTFTALLTPASAAVFEERFPSFQRKGSVQNIEYEWRRKDGSTLPVLLNATAIYDDHGRYVASRATVFDISDRKRAEDERDRFFDVARDLLCIAGFEGRFTRLNPAWERVLGFTNEELLTQPVMELVHVDDRERTLAEFGRLAAGDETTEFEVRCRTKEGHYRWLHWNARSIRVEKLIYASARDVTDSKEAETRIQNLNHDLALRAKQLEAANRELESFSYSVSHDLRAPLRHVDGFAGLLSKHSGDRLDPEAQRYVATISRAAKQMGTLIDDLLAFSRIGRAPLRHQLVQHSQLVADVLANGRFDPEGRITWDIGQLADVYADAAMLRQVWTNLIDNAVKYSSKNPHPHITIGSMPDANGVEFVFFVRDNGVGFDMAYADKLFGVFQRLHGPSEFEGTGIGLANVRRIVARHGGRTWADARVGEGAIFYFSIPIHASTPEFSI